MSLTNAQVRYLRGLSHALRPVVRLGNKGVTATVLAELNQALNHHELVKVQLADDDRSARAATAAALAAQSGAQTVQRIGKVLCLYRRNADSPGIELPR